jgi:hypothetical protein
MNVFHWRTEKKREPAHADKYPQLAYYWRKKQGLTGSREKPVRNWRKEQNGL